MMRIDSTETTQTSGLLFQEEDLMVEAVFGAYERTLMMDSRGADVIL
jgi:hypothetical protein